MLLLNMAVCKLLVLLSTVAIAQQGPHFPVALQTNQGVALYWTFAPGFSYEVWRGTNSTNMKLLAVVAPNSATTPTYLDASVQQDAGYVYQVLAKSEQITVSESFRGSGAAYWRDFRTGEHFSSPFPGYEDQLPRNSAFQNRGRGSVRNEGVSLIVQRKGQTGFTQYLDNIQNGKRYKIKIALGKVWHDGDPQAVLQIQLHQRLPALVFGFEQLKAAEYGTLEGELIGGDKKWSTFSLLAKGGKTGGFVVQLWQIAVILGE